MLLTKILTCTSCILFFMLRLLFFSHVVFKVCIYADPCTVYERKQSWERKEEKKRIRAELILFMDIVR